MKQNPITANKLADGLASPDYCLALHQLGCTQRTAFVWLKDAHGYNPFTYEFDPDHYYVHGDAAIMEVAHYTQIPAYSIEEIKRVFSIFNYTLSKENNFHQLQVNGMVGKNIINSNVMNEREADAFAAVLLSLLQNKLIPIAFVNDQIRHD
jgi:hypothetical protein